MNLNALCEALEENHHSNTAQNMVKLMEISETVWDTAITSNFTKKEGRTIWQ